MNQQPKVNRSKDKSLSRIARSQALERLERFERLIEKIGAPKPRLTRSQLPSSFPRIR